MVYSFLNWLTGFYSKVYTHFGASLCFFHKCILIYSVQSEDAGNYMCVATNDAGVVERSVTLTLQSKHLSSVFSYWANTLLLVSVTTGQSYYNQKLYFSDLATHLIVFIATPVSSQLNLIRQITWICPFFRRTNYHSGASGDSGGCWHHSCAQLSGRG